MEGRSVMTLIREMVDALPVRLLIFLLILAVSYGFTRILKVETTTRFLVCHAVAPLQGWDPAACQTHIKNNIEDFLPEPVR